jgi:hypothetical protein
LLIRCLAEMTTQPAVLASWHSSAAGPSAADPQPSPTMERAKAKAKVRWIFIGAGNASSAPNDEQRLSRGQLTTRPWFPDHVCLTVLHSAGDRRGGTPQTPGAQPSHRFARQRLGLLDAGHVCGEGEACLQIGRNGRGCGPDLLDPGIVARVAGPGAEILARRPRAAAEAIAPRALAPDNRVETAASIVGPARREDAAAQERAKGLLWAARLLHPVPRVIRQRTARRAGEPAERRPALEETFREDRHARTMRKSFATVKRQS